MIVACINTGRLDESERERINKWLAMDLAEECQEMLQS